MSTVALHDMPHQPTDEPWLAAVTSFVSMQKEDASPPREELGLVMQATQLSMEDDLLKIRLHLTAMMPAAVRYGYVQLGKGFVITLHDSFAERITTLSMLDPHKSFPKSTKPNFTRPSSVSEDSMTRVYFNADLEIPVRVPTDDRPSLFLFAAMDRYTSSMLAVSLAGPSLVEPGS